MDHERGQQSERSEQQCSKIGVDPNHQRNGSGRQEHPRDQDHGPGILDTSRLGVTSRGIGGHEVTTECRSDRDQRKQDSSYQNNNVHLILLDAHTATKCDVGRPYTCLLAEERMRAAGWSRSTAYLAAALEETRRRVAIASRRRHLHWAQLFGPIPSVA